MTGTAEVHLFGSLATGQRGDRLYPAHLVLEKPMNLEGLLKSLHIPSGKVQLVMVNHRAVTRNHLIHPGDRVALFPQEYPVYPDWNDFRVRLERDYRRKDYGHYQSVADV